jgi:FkbM family methyltransferase
VFEGQEKVVVHEYALSDSNGQGALITNDLNLSLISRSAECLSADGSDVSLKTIDVPLRRLDEFVTENNIHSVFLLKIDLEGNGLNVLKGGGGVS